MRYTMRRALILFSLAAPAFAAADKKLPLEQSSNDLVEISASYLDKDQVQQELHSNLDGIVVVRVRVRPLSEKPVKIDRDDFTLLETYDGQRSTPYAPSQIAGSSTLVVTPEGTRGSLSGGRPTWGLGGIGMGGGGVGVTSGPSKTTTTVKNDDKENPLLKVLKEKVLPEKEVTDPISGLLFFQIDGKVKAKDLELYYKTPSGKLALRFHP